MQIYKIVLSERNYVMIGIVRMNGYIKEEERIRKKDDQALNRED